jgi:hypothetical protein
MVEDVDEILRRVRLPRPPTAPRTGIRWKGFRELHERKAQHEAQARCQPEPLGTVARALGQIR